MQEIFIRSFGPLQKVHLPITDVMVLNGLQSSGKSTISKAIYFFKSMPELVFKAFLERHPLVDELNKNLVISCRKRLVDIFGTTKHMSNFELRFNYSEDCSITITPEKSSGHARVKFSPGLMDVLKEAAVFFEEESNLKTDLAGDSLFRIERFKLAMTTREKIRQAFGESKEAMFLPAGRSLVSTLSEELRGIESYQIDALTKEFVERILVMRDKFDKDFQGLVEDRKKLTTAPIDFNRVNVAIEIAESILQGKYKWVRGEERIELNDNEYVKMKFSSSGQQEALWILLIIFQLILENKSVFTVIEEPEAHLYPLTQYKMVKLLCLYAAMPGQQIVITTHSPYIVSSINNHLLAYDVGQKQEKAVAQRINPLCWLNPNKVSAYFVQNGLVHDVFDREQAMIDPELIDSASQTINDDFDYLLDLEP